ncbi:hypothetical protein VTL71DRAFT_10323 [Oculimacula yallundae]|uniref:Uncharacterized protein n=1 Tax=Oculimacula yallundae TaxID=86028 RepID=A0ABR4CSP1_9HELO
MHSSYPKLKSSNVYFFLFESFLLLLLPVCPLSDSLQIRIHNQSINQSMLVVSRVAIPPRVQTIVEEQSVTEYDQVTSYHKLQARVFQNTLSIATYLHHIISPDVLKVPKISLLLTHATKLSILHNITHKHKSRLLNSPVSSMPPSDKCISSPKGKSTNDLHFVAETPGIGLSTESRGRKYGTSEEGAKGICSFSACHKHTRKTQTHAIEMPIKRGPAMHA